MFWSEPYFLLTLKDSEIFFNGDQQICRKINKSAEESTVELANFNIVKNENRQW